MDDDALLDDALDEFLSQSAVADAMSLNTFWKLPPELTSETLYHLPCMLLLKRIRTNDCRF